MEVLDRIKEAGVHHEEWLRQLREASGFTGDDSKLLKVISAYEAAHAAMRKESTSDLANSDPWRKGRDNIGEM